MVYTYVVRLLRQRCISYDKRYRTFGLQYLLANIRVTRRSVRRVVREVLTIDF